MQFLKFNNFFIAKFLTAYFLTFLNLILFYKHHNFYIYFINLNESFLIKFISCINWLFGFSFIPFLILLLAIALEQNEKQTKKLFLIILGSFSLDLIFSSFEFGSPFCNLIFYFLNFKITLMLGLIINLINLGFLILPEILQKQLEETIETKIPFVSPLIKKTKNIKDKTLPAEVSSLPNINLLKIGPKIEVKIDIEEQKSLLIRTLKDFGIEAKITEVFIGPVVTLYSIEIAAGVKAIRVINLSDDIARSMQAFSTRISSVPGKNLLGIEISNQKRQIVYFKEGISSDKYQKFQGNLPIYLGCNIYGEHEVFDLSTMPHLLVAGTTGSGKSVGIHTMLLSMLFKKTSKEFKLILIDPKQLELTPYEEIPHLLLPVVTEAKEAINAVKWAVKEMEFRNKAMSKLGVRNISSYNAKTTQETFPFIVIVIDEMADLMLIAGKEFEIYVQRLAQMGRAAGLHIIMATQRPSVNVITGTIKANFPTRISFKLSTKIDSRTILGDMSGAEQLLGAGDMLYLGNNGKVNRIHGSYITEEDVADVVEFLRSQGSPNYIDLPNETDEDENIEKIAGNTRNEEVDSYYEEAIQLIRTEKKVSTSFLQRHFPIGYNRAAKIIEKMEKDGIITKGDRFGRNREIL